MQFDNQPLEAIPAHCQYYADSTIKDAACLVPVDAQVEPKPAGQFAPALLCADHVWEFIDDHTFHLGTDWSITPVSEEAAERVRAAEGEPVNNIDPELQVSCESCGHDKLDHAFYPAADGYIGAPAPFCNAPYRPDDATLIDHTCECEGFVSIPHA